MFKKAIAFFAVNLAQNLVLAIDLRSEATITSKSQDVVCDCTEITNTLTELKDKINALTERLDAEVIKNANAIKAAIDSEAENRGIAIKTAIDSEAENRNIAI
jgi:hypothetical protein